MTAPVVWDARLLAGSIGLDVQDIDPSLFPVVNSDGQEVAVFDWSENDGDGYQVFTAAYVGVSSPSTVRINMHPDDMMTLFATLGGWLLRQSGATDVQVQEFLHATVGVTMEALAPEFDRFYFEWWDPAYPHIDWSYYDGSTGRADFLVGDGKNTIRIFLGVEQIQHLFVALGMWAINNYGNGDRF